MPRRVAIVPPSGASRIRGDRRAARGEGGRKLAPKIVDLEVVRSPLASKLLGDTLSAMKKHTRDEGNVGLDVSERLDVGGRPWLRKSFGGLLAMSLPSIGLLSLGLLSIGCDEKKEPESTTTTKPAEPEPVAAPVVPTPQPAAEAPKPKKKLEDCPADGLVIENADLEAAIRLKAEKPEGELTQADLKKLRSLNLSRVDIPELDICLFTHMSELRELFLGPSGIDDLSPIKNSTKMETLGIARNPISDLGPVSEMTKLDRLDVAKTKVSDLTPLKMMTALTELTLDGTEVTDLSPISGLSQLERLSLKETKIKDIKMLSDFKNLKFLYIAESDVDISQTGPLAQNGTKVIMD